MVREICKWMQEFCLQNLGNNVFHRVKVEELIEQGFERSFIHVGFVYLTETQVGAVS
jgi:hypothetical protein